MSDASYERQGSSEDVRLILTNYSYNVYLINVNLYVTADWDYNAYRCIVRVLILCEILCQC